jgi:hypothetical protein
MAHAMNIATEDRRQCSRTIYPASSTNAILYEIDMFYRKQNDAKWEKSGLSGVWKTIF